MSKLIAIMVFMLLASAPAQSQAARPSSVAELAAYTGADRQQILLEGARKEGKAVWYTVVSSYREIAKVFEAKYPGVRIEGYRTRSANLVKRILSEARAGRHTVDVIEAPEISVKVVHEAKLLAPYTSPYVARHPESAKKKGPNGLVYWAVDQESYIGVGYNKNVIRAADVPKNFEDLLKPALKDKMAIDGGGSGRRVMGAMLKAKGEGYVRKLKRQNMKLLSASLGVLHGMVVSGEVPISPGILQSMVLGSIAKGAPVGWVPMDLVINIAGNVALYAHSRHPHAALLFADFLISPDGQKVLVERFKMGSPVKDYGFQKWNPFQGKTVAQYDKVSTKWIKLLREITVKK